MKTLLILRHAKSSWKHPELADHERPLNKRGKKDAPYVGQVLLDRELVPQRILSSTAARARQTAEAVVETCHYSGNVDYLDSLYMAEPQAILDTLRVLPDEVERVMLIGHNPGSEALLQSLTRQIVALPTAALAHLAVPIQTWKDLTLETDCELVELILPPEKEAVEIQPVEQAAPKPPEGKKKAKEEPAPEKPKSGKKPHAKPVKHEQHDKPEKHEKSKKDRKTKK